MVNFRIGEETKVEKLDVPSPPEYFEDLPEDFVEKKKGHKYCVECGKDLTENWEENSVPGWLVDDLGVESKDLYYCNVHLSSLLDDAPDFVEEDESVSASSKRDYDLVR